MVGNTLLQAQQQMPGSDPMSIGQQALMQLPNGQVVLVNLPGQGATQGIPWSS